MPKIMYANIFVHADGINCNNKRKQNILRLIVERQVFVSW